MADVERHVLDRLARGPATLAGLRAALPDAHPDRRALPSMGEPDPFGDVVARLVAAGAVLDREGVYALPEP